MSWKCTALEEKENTGSEQCGALESLKLALTNNFVESIDSWTDW